MKKNNAILSIVGIAIAIMLPLSAVMVFKYKEKSRVTVKFPKYYFPIGLDTVKDEDGKTRIDTLYRTIKPYTATTQNGQPFSSESLKGKLYVAEFFFASCPGICPKMNDNMMKVQKEFLNDDVVKIISFTIDPERDSISALKKYAEEKGAIPGKWTFLRTNTQQEVFDLGRNEFGLTTQNGDGGPGDFEHSDKFVLVDGNGHIRGYYNGTDSASINNLMGDIILIISNKNNR